MGTNSMALVRDVLGTYRSTTAEPATEEDVLQAAEDILRRRVERCGELSRPSDSASFLRMRLGHLPHEEFHAVWLDSRHRILGVERLFTGTLDAASVYPREVVRAALRLNASAVVFAHNHPSGLAEPSSADRAITAELRKALELVSVRLLDHVVVGATEAVSMAERGFI